MSVGVRYGTTGMFPVIHCLRVRSCLISGPTIFHAFSRCLRRTAVRMNVPATSRAPGASFTVLGGFSETATGCCVFDVSVLPFELGTNLTITARTPAASTSAATHGSTFCQRGRLGNGSRTLPMFLALSIVTWDAHSRYRLARVKKLSRRSENRRLAPDAPDLAECVAHLAHRHVGPRSLDDRRHEVPVGVGRVVLQPGERGLDRGRVAAGAERLDPVDLLALERRVDAEDLRRLLVLELVAVDAHDDALTRLDLALVAERGLGDLALEEVFLDRGDHPAELLDSVEVLV